MRTRGFVVLSIFAKSMKLDALFLLEIECFCCSKDKEAMRLSDTERLLVDAQGSGHLEYPRFGLTHLRTFQKRC